MVQVPHRVGPVTTVGIITLSGSHHNNKMLPTNTSTSTTNTTLKLLSTVPVVVQDINALPTCLYSTFQFTRHPLNRRQRSSSSFVWRRLNRSAPLLSRALGTLPRPFETNFSKCCAITHTPPLPCSSTSPTTA